MERLKKITRKDINKNSMVTLGYCQCQNALNRFAYDYKIGYNVGVYGWNYDLYRICGVDIVTGYNCPHENKTKKDTKAKLIAFENKLQTLSFSKACEKKEELKKEFLEIFK